MLWYGMYVCMYIYVIHKHAMAVYCTLYDLSVNSYFCFNLYSVSFLAEMRQSFALHACPSSGIRQAVPCCNQENCSLEYTPEASDLEQRHLGEVFSSHDRGRFPEAAFDDLHPEWGRQMGSVNLDRCIPCSSGLGSQGLRLVRLKWSCSSSRLPQTT